MQIAKKAWAAWKRIGQAIGDLIGRIVLSLFYFTFLMPFGLGVRLFSDPMGIKRKRGSNWLPRSTREADLKNARRLS